MIFLGLVSDLATGFPGSGNSVAVSLEHQSCILFSWLYIDAPKASGFDEAWWVSFLGCFDVRSCEKWTEEASRASCFPSCTSLGASVTSELP